MAVLAAEYLKPMIRLDRVIENLRNEVTVCTRRFIARTKTYQYSTRSLLGVLTVISLLLGTICFTVKTRERRVNDLINRGVGVVFAEPTGLTASAKRAIAGFFGTRGVYDVTVLTFGTRLDAIEVKWTPKTGRPDKV